MVESLGGFGEGVDITLLGGRKEGPSTSLAAALAMMMMMIFPLLITETVWRPHCVRR
jgi:hypothetical protein